MSFIYSFLQKRKMHESQHGYLLVFTAYILSAFMLLVGSDLFYNINTAAAGTETKEEAQDLLNVGVYNFNNGKNATQLTARGLINPYGLEDNITMEKDALSTENDSKSMVDDMQSMENDTIFTGDNTLSMGGNANTIEDLTSSKGEDEENSDSTITSSDTVWLLGTAMDDKTFDSVMQKIGPIKQAKRKDKASTKKLNVTPVIKTKYGKLSVNEINMLEHIVQAEAGGEDMIGKVLVANVIMNRVSNKHFPKSIKGVIFQQKHGSYQFSPVGNGRYWSVRISQETKKAVKKALNGVDYSKGALYFAARKRANPNSMRWFDRKLERLFKHGGHEFYKNR